MQVISRDSEAYKGYQRLCSTTLSGSTKSLNVSDEIPSRSRSLDKWGDSANRNETHDARAFPSRNGTDYGKSSVMHQGHIRASPARSNHTPERSAGSKAPDNMKTSIKAELEKNTNFSKRSDDYMFTSTPRDPTMDRSNASTLASHRLNFKNDKITDCPD